MQEVKLSYGSEKGQDNPLDKIWVYSKEDKTPRQLTEDKVCIFLTS